MRLHIFNPDTDYALASGLNHYTPPASVKTLRAGLSLLPALYAAPGEAILLLDPVRAPLDTLPGFPLIARKSLKIVTPEMLQGQPLSITADAPLTPAPWGWNHAMRTLLLKYGFPEQALPSVQSIDTIRRLSHRAAASRFNVLLGCRHAARELTGETEVAEFVSRYPDAWLKAPWSSSGRGVISCADLEMRHILPWARGIIRRQGSVMAETAARRSLDFATEWLCSRGHALFLGLSVFSTSSRGKYHGNLLLPQHLLEARIKEAAPEWDGSIIENQRRALDLMIAPCYDGPLGIDMLAEEDGTIRPCVEINLRMTMGHVALHAKPSEINLFPIS